MVAEGESEDYAESVSRRMSERAARFATLSFYEGIDTSPMGLFDPGLHKCKGCRLFVKNTKGYCDSCEEKRKRSRALPHPVFRQSKTFVYFIGPEGGDVVKIGWSVDPEQRLATLQSGSPVPLKFFCAVEADSKFERDLHRAFDEYRSHGEWFRRSERVERAMQAILDGDGPALIEAVYGSAEDLERVAKAHP